MRASLKMLVVGLAVVMGLSAGPAWSQERDIEKELGIHVDKVLEGSEEIKPGEDMGGPHPGRFTPTSSSPITTLCLSGCRGDLIVATRSASPCRSTPGIPMVTPLFVGDWQGDTKLCAKAALTGRVWKQTVTGRHVTYRWNIGKF